MLLHVVIFYILALVSCVGAGSILWTAISRKLVSGTNGCAAPSPSELGVVGLLALGIYSVSLNFVMPVSTWLSLLVLVVCLIAGSVCLFRAPRPGLFKLLVILFVITLFSIWGLKFILRGDSGLYHLQVISWIKDEPIVFGLANVHHRFGFNSFWLSVLAVFWLPLYEIKGVLLANYLPSMLFILVLTNRLLNTSRTGQASLSISTIFALCCVAVFSVLPLLLMPTTTSTDLAPNVFTMLSVFIFLKGFGEDRYPAAKVNKDNLMLWIIAVFAVMTKLSAVTPGLLALIHMLYYRDVIGMVTVRRTAFFLAGVSSIWVLRNFFLSGCLFYPVGITCMETDMIQWSVGSDNADATRTIIERWAKAPVPITYLTDGASSNWFENWLQMPNRGGRLVTTGLRVLGVLIAGLVYLLLLRFFQKNKPDKPKKPFHKPLAGIGLAMLAALFGMLFGFVTAPDPRFWWATFIILLTVPAMAAMFLLIRQGISIGSRSIIAALFLAATVTGTHLMISGISWQTIIHPVGAFRKVVPVPRTKLVPAIGFDMRKPVSDRKCWLAPKPCSPEDPVGLSQYRMGPYLVFVRQVGLE